MAPAGHSRAQKPQLTQAWLAFGLQWNAVIAAIRLVALHRHAMQLILLQLLLHLRGELFNLAQSASSGRSWPTLCTMECSAMSAAAPITTKPFCSKNRLQLQQSVFIIPIAIGYHCNRRGLVTLWSAAAAPLPAPEYARHTPARPPLPIPLEQSYKLTHPAHSWSSRADGRYCPAKKIYAAQPSLVCSVGLKKMPMVFSFFMPVPPFLNIIFLFFPFIITPAQPVPILS